MLADAKSFLCVFVLDLASQKTKKKKENSGSLCSLSVDRHNKDINLKTVI